DPCLSRATQGGRPPGRTRCRPSRRCAHVGGAGMSVLVVGLSHRSAPVELLERTALPDDGLAKLLADTVSADHVDEAFVLATCNRLEVYADVRKFHGGVQEVTERIVARTGVPLEELADHLYVHYDDRAVQH